MSMISEWASGHLYYKYLLIYYYSGALHKCNIIIIIIKHNAHPLYALLLFFNYKRRIVRSVFNIPIPQPNASLDG
jgi:hypothetical protein